MSKGDLEKRRDHDESALAFYREAASIYERIGVPVGVTTVMAEIPESDIKAGRADDAIAGIRRGLPLALQCENRYAINKFSEMLNRLGIDPDAFLSVRS